MTLDEFRARFPIFRSRVYVNSCSQGALSTDVDEAAGGIRSHRACHEPRAFGQQRFEIGRTQPSEWVGGVHAPPDDARAGALQRQPGRDVGLVIELADDDLGP